MPWRILDEGSNLDTANLIELGARDLVGGVDRQDARWRCQEREKVITRGFGTGSLIGRQSIEE